MYKTFMARNFKLFKQFKIDGFQRVNLLAGRNNVGKTSLLEAIFLHSGAANVRLPFSIEAFRGVTQFQVSLASAVSGLFNDFDSTPPVELEGIDGVDIKRTCRLRIVPTQTVVPADSREGIVGTEAQAFEITFFDPTRSEPASGRAMLQQGQLRLDAMPIPALYNGFFLSSKAVDHKSDADRFSEMAKRVGEEERFVQALRILEPAVKGVRLLNHGGVTMIHVDVGLKRFLPLPYAGEGMVKLASILVAISNARQGVVLIDEFENGVHYSVLGRVWRAVVDFAERSDTQIFATTHSAECIRAAHEMFNEREYTFRLFRLHRREDGAIEASPFDRDAVEAAIKSDLELR